MSFDGLRIGSSGLAASQRALETTAHNLANVNTPGYSRQRIETATAAARLDHRGLMGPGASGQGVAIVGITVAQDALLAENLRDQSALHASWDTRAGFAARAEQVLGPLEGGTSDALSSFWNAWEDLSSSPESTTARNVVLQNGQQVASALNTSSRRLDSLLKDVASDLATTTVAVNGLASQIASLNTQISRARSAGSNPADLQDQRALALTELTTLTGARTTFERDGDARVTLGSMPLVDGASSTPLTASASPVSLTWPDGRAVAATGKLGALIEFADTGITDIAARLDQIAAGLIDVVNTAHADGYGLDGVGGRPFFNGTNAATIAVDPAMTTSTVAASALGAANDGNHALAMGALREKLAAAGATVGDLFNSLQGIVGLQSTEAGTQSRITGSIVTQLKSQLGASTGVSADEELTDMLRYQRSYEAAARVVTVIDEMLDRLINGMGAR